MGHKVNPNGFRLGITTKWTSNWYAEGKTYGENLLKDIAVRTFLKKKLAQASVSRIQIDRPAKSARVTIHTARPGIVIGKKGEDIEKLKQDGMTLLYTTHYMEEAQRLCDRIAVMNDGKSAAIGTMLELAQQTGDVTANLETIFL
jgi:ribosomal protein S3